MEELDQGFKGFDFKAAIEDLKARALLARQTRRIIAISMFFAIFTAVTVVYFFNVGGITSYRSFAERISNSAPRDPSIFLRTSRDLLNKAYPDELVAMGKAMDGEKVKKVELMSEERLAYLHEVDRLVGLYERAEKASKAKEPESAMRGSDWVSSLSSIAFSIGAIALAILMLQVAISFLRYYSQLAELYDAQAGALIASNGNADRAVKFFEAFSPTPVSFGKTPLTLYERAFDALTSIKGREK
ncbi:hypothetical protein [Pseudomonas sp. 22 E 5]|uniref:hypothetical protein n=1 Tax=Pseudomonas canadensis TaxID=915099 RepID=UPI000812612C|nr:hypothetical protein [Pseudomonas sp. 22 E 5]